MAKIFLKVDNLTVNYFGGYVGIEAVSFSVQEKEIMPFFGYKFSGKSSLARAIAGLEKHSGDIKFFDDVEKQMVYSFSFDQLKKNELVKDTLAYPLKIRKIYDENIVINKAKYYLIEDLLYKKIKELTDEQKAIVCLCRAMIRDCKLYILDNPLSSLSSENREKYFELLKKDLVGKTAIYTTDIYDEAYKLNEKVGIISRGKLQQIGTKEEILKRPNSVACLNAVGAQEFQFGILEKVDGKCKINIKQNKIDTKDPISDVYLNKEIIVPIIDGALVNNIYFDKESEYIISR